MNSGAPSDTNTDEVLFNVTLVKLNRLTQAFCSGLPEVLFQLAGRPNPWNHPPAAISHSDRINPPD